MTFWSVSTSKIRTREYAPPKLTTVAPASWIIVGENTEDITHLARRALHDDVVKNLIAPSQHAISTVLGRLHHWRTSEEEQ